MARASRPVAPRIYVDSCVYLDLIVKNDRPQIGANLPRWQTAAELFEAVNADRVVLAASALVEAEVLANGEVRGSTESVRGQIRAWFNAPATLWTDVDRFLARDAAALAAICAPLRYDRNKTFGGGDATHLAAAIRLQCDYLFTQDGGFPLGHNIRLPDSRTSTVAQNQRDASPVQVIRPARVWQASLFDSPVP